MRSSWFTGGQKWWYVIVNGVLHINWNWIAPGFSVFFFWRLLEIRPVTPRRSFGDSSNRILYRPDHPTVLRHSLTHLHLKIDKVWLWLKLLQLIENTLCRIRWSETFSHRVQAECVAFTFQPEVDKDVANYIFIFISPVGDVNVWKKTTANWRNTHSCTPF